MAMTNPILKKVIILFNGMRISKTILPVNYGVNFSTTKTFEYLSNNSSIPEPIPPVLPKKPMNAYSSFVKDKFREVKSGLSVPTPSKNMFSMIAEMWRKMPLEEKSEYFKKADEYKNSHKMELENIYKNMSSDELKAFQAKISSNRIARIQALKKLRIKKERRRLKEPKRPAGAFFLYLKTLDRGEAPVQEFIKGAAAKWRLLPEEDKQKYINEAKKLFEAYSKEKNLWDTDMITTGKQKYARRYFLRSLMKIGSKNKTKPIIKAKSKKKSRSSKKTKKPKSTIKKQLVSNAAGSLSNLVAQI